MKGYGKMLKKLPISDWKIIAQFNRIVKNYLKMKQIKTKSMESKELLSIILNYESEIKILYERYCLGDINKLIYQEKQKNIVEKQIELIDQFKKEVLLKFLYWWIPEIHSQDAHSQVNQFEKYIENN